MADQLATPQQLANLLQLTWADLSADQQATLTMLVELATAKVQDACGQRLVDAESTAVIDVEMWECDRYLPLPQRPVRSVESVEIDGEACTDYLLRSQQLWRLYGWNVNSSAPTQVTVAFTHGYLDGDQALQPAVNDTLVLARMGWGNPSGVTGESLDDYRVTYAEADARMQVTPPMRDALIAAYGTGAYVVGSR